MRIIGGQFSGRRISAPGGSVSRPTADRTREALFNILASRSDVVFEGARVLDLFAGSGALGLEAMSRGASWCLFVDTSAAARGAIHENIEALGLFGATRLHRRSAGSLGKRTSSAGGPYTLAFLDPPYGKELASAALTTLREGDWLADGAIVVIEQGKDETPVSAIQFTQLDRRAYGAAQIGVYGFSG